MKNVERQSAVLLWIARIGGLVISISWITFLIATGIREHQNGVTIFTLKSILLGILILTSTIGVGIAWINPELGGKVTIISSLFLCIFAYFAAGSFRFFAVTVSGIPFFLVGLLSIQSLSEKNT